MGIDIFPLVGEQNHDIAIIILIICFMYSLYIILDIFFENLNETKSYFHYHFIYAFLVWNISMLYIFNIYWIANKLGNRTIPNIILLVIVNSILTYYYYLQNTVYLDRECNLN